MYSLFLNTHVYFSRRSIVTSEQSVLWDDQMPFLLCFRINFVLRHCKFRHLFQLSLHLLKLYYRSSWCNFQQQISQLYGRSLIDVTVSSVQPGILSVLFTVSSPETKECLVHGINSLYICCVRMIRNPIISVYKHRLARYPKVLIPGIL